MKVTAILKGMIDKNGHQPIQIRIYHEGRPRFYPTHIKVDPELFKDGRITSKHPKARELNQKIETLIIQQQARALEGLDRKMPKVDFYTFHDQLLKRVVRSKETLRQYGSQITKLKEFAPSLRLVDITPEWLGKYYNYLKSKGNGPTTIWSSFKFLRTIVRQAKKGGLIQSYPFDHYEFPKYIEPDKLYLTEEEVKKIDKFLSTNKGIARNLQEAGWWFLIACDTGLRISDLEQFDRAKNIVGDRLVVRTAKTKEMIGQPLDKHLSRLFEKVEFKRISMHRNTYNELIKIVAAAAGVNKHITSHTARHTAAMSLANKGVSQELTAKILGHRDLRSTQVYYKITNERVDMELKKRRR